MQKARHWDKKKGNTVECYLCPHHCTISEGKSGRCRVRKNISGVLHTENYGMVTAINIDPIEKKPLYNFYPGRPVLSIGTFGCNFRCSFCQNWQIAHEKAPARKVGVEQLLEIADEAAASDGSVGIAYTYSEPMMWFEYIMDVAPQTQERGHKNILVTNGFIEKKPFRELLPFIAAMNIDLKGFSSEFYTTIIKGSYEPVLDTAVTAKENDCHIEITTLLIPGKNDSEQEIRELVEWIAGSLGKDTPLHFSRYFPNYKLHLKPTPVRTLERAYEIASEKLDYVYLGNILDPERGNTYCPDCGEKLIERTGYNTVIKALHNGQCKRCGKEVNIIS